MLPITPDKGGAVQNLINFYIEWNEKEKNNDLIVTSIYNEDAKNFDVELFLARAHSIREMLVNKLNVPAGHIFIEKNVALVQSLDPEKTCVIMYINE